MFFLKLLVGITAVVTVTLFAKLKCKKLYSEYSFYNSLCEYLKSVKSSAGYKKAKLSEITVKNDEFIGFLGTFPSDGKTESLNMPDYLSEAEKLKIITLFSLIVSSDASTLCDALNLYIAEYSALAEEKRAKLIKQKPVYIKVGFSVGLMLFIMVI